MNKLYILLFLFLVGCTDNSPSVERTLPQIKVTVTENCTTPDNQTVLVVVDYGSHLYSSSQYTTAKVELRNLKEMDDYADQLENVVARIKTARARLNEIQHPLPEKQTKFENKI